MKIISPDKEADPKWLMLPLQKYLRVLILQISGYVLQKLFSYDSTP